MSLVLQDAEMLRDNFKCPCNENNNKIENICDIINKEKILKEFETINKKIRKKYNVLNYYMYDNILNNCVIDTCIELLSRERKYGENHERNNKRNNNRR